MRILVATVVFLAAVVPTPRLHAAGLTPADLRCEYLKDPPGIDIPQPRLSWILEAKSAKSRGLAQGSYQILVASSPDKLKSNQGDLWDTGRVGSDRSIHVRYAGRPLTSGQACYWKVKVWSSGGGSGSWSEPARWTMGLLKPDDWKAQWIGKDEAETKSTLENTRWIWFPEGDPAAAASIGTHYFRHAFELPANRDVQSARFLVAGDNQWTAFLNGTRLGDGASFKAASTFDVAPHLRAGANLLAVSVTNAGETPNPAGLVGRLEIRFADGSTFSTITDSQWKAAEKAAEGWQKTDFDVSAWAAAKELGPVGMPPWGEVSGPEDRRLVARFLRKEFAVEKTIRRATLYVSGLGLSECYLNGKKVGDHVLSPGLTEYTKRVFYVTHDVTGLLQAGRNAVGVILGNGRYYAPRGKVPAETLTYGFPRLCLQLELELVDGTTQTVLSDPSWKLTTQGPIRANNEYDGEEYDARLEMSGWAAPGFDDASWETPRTVAAPGGVLVAQMMPPIRVVETVKPVALKELSPGVHIYDLGQNLVGWCRLKVSGPAGTKVTLRHAEILKPDGSLYLDNIRSAQVTDTYILKGQGTETYEPRFTYHGFRYVELKGHPGQPDLATLEGCVVHDDLDSAGDWTCSNPLLNRIYQNVRWGVRGNYRSLSTDCPQRDERQGWLGDRSAESKGETFLFHTAALYSKWVQDMADAQKESGSVPDVCPPYWPIYSDNVTWPSSTVIIPGHLFVQFGDTALIARHYPSMKRWMDYMATFLKDNLMPRDTYGDWCVPPEDPKLIHSQDPLRKTDGTLLGTAYYYHCLNLMAGYATLLKESGDAAAFRDLAARIKAAFNAKFLAADGTHYDNGSQTSCVLPLAFGLVPPQQRDQVFAHLVDKITRETKSHVGTGLIGGQWLMRTLAVHNRSDLAYTLASQKTYPSWGYMVEKGATTIWELWNGDTADPAMNSGNHVMLVGDLILWLYEDVAGIRSDPEQPGFKQIIMKPSPVGDLEWVKASHRSPYGWIRSEWRRQGPAFAWEIEVPPNTVATVLVPTEDPADVQESGRRPDRSPEVELLPPQPGYAVYSVGSGRYRFTVR